ncbi:PTS sugar transporter subunit IIC [Lactobacillus amylovorus]|uniref:PTS sugar transporter subunit IIC n=1 Tax=Lactobacillus amylovorus TaxID=1604 RepID=UPI002330360F|nr:PTS transporter subunit EIIC [Lactobacillus amylovorus]MDB6268913.1 PTS transporter subunit EIIC [Lactobacillus amylovorus]MDB6270050.1 PTS transporter subunit EIIC [Lactobacillus amylovorus]
MNEANEAKNYKIVSWVQQHVAPIAGKISQQKYLAVVRDGMTAIIPVTIIGGIAAIISSPPVPTTLKAINFITAFLLAWRNWATANIATLTIPYNLTMGLLGLYTVIAIAYYLTQHYKMNLITNEITAILAFLIIASPSVTIKNVTYLPAGNLGATGMFAGIIVAIIAVEVNRLFISHHISIKLPPTVPPNVAAPFEVLIPMVVTTFVLFILNNWCVALTHNDIASVIYLLSTPFTNLTGTLPVILLIAFLATTLWFFGIHGNNMLGAIVTPITTLNVALNLKQYNAGQPMTHIFAGSFYSVFGGWITYTAFLIAMIMFAKSARLKALWKIGIPGTLFNINEPLIFGIPTVLNIYFYIPIVICEMINLSVAYFLMATNILGKFYIMVPWSTPGLIQVFLASMDWKNCVLWIALLVLDVVICSPFLKVYDKQLVKEESGQAAK